MTPPADPLLESNAFRVRIGDQEIAFASVGSMTSGTDPASSEGRPVDQYAPIVLKRALTGSSELFDWRRAIVDGKRDRRSVTIHQLEGAGGRIANSWRLVRAWPCRWSGPALNALESGIAFEEVEVAFDDLVWLRPRPPRRSSRPTSQGA
jgi:phage tail-like protein